MCERFGVAICRESIHKEVNLLYCMYDVNCLLGGAKCWALIEEQSTQKLADTNEK